MKLKSIYEVKEGRVVMAYPKNGDFGFEFMGTVVGFKNEKYIQVKDQEDNVFDCDPDQVEVI